MTPGLYLILLLLLTLLAMIISHRLRRRRERELSRLAAEWKMHFTATDRFKLAPRVAEHFPIAGAADLRVVDLIYGKTENHRHYYFTAEYTLGVVNTKRRVHRAVMFREPIADPQSEAVIPILLAPADLPLPEQYRQLRANAVESAAQTDTGFNSQQAGSPA